MTTTKRTMTLGQAVDVLNAHEHAGYSSWRWGDVCKADGRFVPMAFAQSANVHPVPPEEDVVMMTQREAIAAAQRYVEHAAGRIERHDES